MCVCVCVKVCVCVCKRVCVCVCANRSSRFSERIGVFLICLALSAYLHHSTGVLTGLGTENLQHRRSASPWRCVPQLMHTFTRLPTARGIPRLMWHAACDAPQRLQRLIDVLAHRAHVCDQDRARIASERVLEHARQRALAIWHVRSVLHQRTDHLR